MRFFIAMAVIMTFSVSPAADGTIWFGNPDGSPLVLRIDSIQKIPVWIQTNPDVYVAAVHIPLATDDRFIVERLGINTYAPFTNDDVPEGYDKGWDVVDVMEAKPQIGKAGFTCQNLLAFMDLMKKPNLPLHCEMQCLAMDFVVKTASDDSLRGGTYDVLAAGYDERSHGLHFSDTLGVRTFAFEAVFSPIYFLYPGDINNDLRIDEQDVSQLKSFLDGEIEIPWPEQRADFNADGAIDKQDLELLEKSLISR